MFINILGGPGVGSDIECVVLSQAISMVFGDLHMWSITNNEGYKCLLIVLFASNTSCLHYIQVHRILCAFHIFCLGQPPLTCSPFLLCHMIWGFNNLINSAFVELSPLHLSRHVSTHSQNPTPLHHLFVKPVYSTTNKPSTHILSTMMTLKYMPTHANTHK